MAKIEVIEDDFEGVKARSVLWYLTFFGFAINYVSISYQKLKKNGKN